MIAVVIETIKLIVVRGKSRAVAADQVAVVAVLILAALAFSVAADREVAGDGIWHVPPQCGGDIHMGAS